MADLTNVRIAQHGSAKGTVRLLGLALLSNSGAVIGTLAPTFVNAFVASGLTLAVASRMAATEFFAMALTLLAAPLVVNRIDRRLLAIGALIAATAGQLLTLSITDTAMLMACRALAGAGEGLLYAVAIASLSATPSPDRAFGIAIASNQVAGTLLLALIAWLARTSPGSAALAVTGIFIASNVLFVPALAARPSLQGSSASTTRQAMRLIPVLSGLAGMFLLSAGFGMVWPIVGQIGAARGFSAGVIAATFSVVGIGGVLGAVSAAWLAVRLGRYVPLLVGCLGMALALVGTASPVFVGATILAMAFWAFNLPYFLGLLAELDTSGRLAVLSGAMIPFGIAAGQLATPTALGMAGFVGVAMSGAACLVAALIVMLLALRALAPAALPIDASIMAAQ